MCVIDCSMLNLNRYKELVEEIKKYVTLQVDYTKYTVIEKVVVLLTAIAMVSILGALGLCVLFYLSMSLSSWLSVVFGSVCLAYFTVAVCYAVLLIVIYVERTKWIADPIARFLTKLFLNPKE